MFSRRCSKIRRPAPRWWTSCACATPWPTPPTDPTSGPRGGCAARSRRRAAGGGAAPWRCPCRPPAADSPATAKVILRLLENRPGELTRFAFEPSAREVARLSSGPVVLEGEFSGQLRAWPVDAEHLAVEVGGNIRWYLDLGERAGLSCSLSAVAEQRFLIAPGEVVEIVIPPSGGSCVLRGLAFEAIDPLPAGLEIQGDAFRVTLKELLAAHEHALVVKMVTPGVGEP